MTRKSEIAVEFERHIHGDLGNCAFYFLNTANEKYENDKPEGIYLDMMATLVFSAFSIEAKVNFVGWKMLADGWPEKASFWEKCSLLAQLYDFQVDRGQRPWQTISQLVKLRNILAHGKPDAGQITGVVEGEPDVRDYLKQEWESTVTREFINRCYEDCDSVWKSMLESCEINVADTVTIAHASLRSVVEPDYEGD